MRKIYKVLPIIIFTMTGKFDKTIVGHDSYSDDGNTIVDHSLKDRILTARLENVLRAALDDKDIFKSLKALNLNPQQLEPDKGNISERDITERIYAQRPEKAYEDEKMVRMYQRIAAGALTFALTAGIVAGYFYLSEGTDLFDLPPISDKK